MPVAPFAAGPPCSRQDLLARVADLSFEEAAVRFLTLVVGFEREGSSTGKLRFSQANIERLDSTRTLSDAHARARPARRDPPAGPFIPFAPLDDRARAPRGYPRQRARRLPAAASGAAAAADRSARAGCSRSHRRDRGRVQPRAENATKVRTAPRGYEGVVLLRE